MFSLNCRGRLVVASHPLVMGIINITPDSFYDMSRHRDPGKILERVEQMVSEGADIIDVGAQSTRPHAELLSAEDELMRLSDIIELITTGFPELLISVDTFYSRVAVAAVEAGASMVNDISAGNMDEKMIPAVSALQVPYICMHMRGTPQTMHQYATYDDVTTEVLDYFIKKTDLCIKAGIKDVIIDPGFGFSKTIVQNFELLKNMNALKIIGRPILAGLSRKATIYKTLGITPGEALNGTTVLNTVALMNGASILRVHDVKEARECVLLAEKVKGVDVRGEDTSRQT